MTDLYWVSVIKAHFVKIHMYEYAAWMRDIERNLYAQYSNGKELELGDPIPLTDKSLGHESFFLSIIEDVEKVMKSKYKMDSVEFRKLIKDLIPLAREEKLNQIFIK